MVIKMPPFVFLIATNLFIFVNCIILHDETKHCLTKSCITLAADLLDSIDFSTDPCDDFFNFTCGKWIKENIIPDDRVEYSINTLIEQRVEKEMKVLLETANNKTTSKAIAMTRNYYKNCIDIKKVNSLKSDPLIKALDQFGGWPILQTDWSEDATDITELMGKIIKEYGGNVFISTSVSSNWKEPNKTMLYIDQASLGLGYGSRDYYLNDSLYKDQMDAYTKYIKDVLKLLATDLHLKKVNYDEVDDLVAFEKQLAKITIPEEDRRNYSEQYNPMTIAQLTVLIPTIKIKRFFELILPVEVNDFIQNPSFRLNVNFPRYIRDLNAFLSKSNKKTIFNYVFWRLFKTYVSALDVRYENVQQEFLRVFAGREQKPIRWKQCMKITINSLKLSSGALYVREYFTEEDKAETLEMIRRLLMSMKDMITKLDWMDSATKDNALQKADTIRNTVGYPDFILNDTALDVYYKKLDYKASDSYFEIKRRVGIWIQDKNFNDLLEPFDRDRFEMSPATVNAYYSSEKNSINFPAAILKYPYFQKELPNFINYGATGATIGHEITHGFDDSGSQYDKFGALFNWWSESSFTNFQKKTECMIKQYDQYIAPGTTTHLSGKRTLGENVADNGGLKEAFKAYLSYVKETGKEELRLPALDQFTNEQMFFISYAYSWCGKQRPESELQHALTDVHSTPMFRVNGVVVNSQDFTDVFKCKKGTKMNPDPAKQPKCSVW